MSCSSSGREQLEEAGELELRLGLDPKRAHDGQVARALHGVVEQRRLADSGFATHEERPAAPTPAAQQQLVDAGTGGVPTDEHAFTVAPLTSVNKAPAAGSPTNGSPDRG